SPGRGGTGTGGGTMRPVSGGIYSLPAGDQQASGLEETDMARMSVPDKDHRLFTIEEYLALEHTEEERHEYLDGCVYAMAGGSPDHGRICVNLTRRLAEQLDSSGSEGFSQDLKIPSGPPPRPRQSLPG